MSAEHKHRVGECADCHEVKSLRSLGLCGTCYYRRRRAKPPVSTIPGIDERIARYRERVEAGLPLFG